MHPPQAGHWLTVTLGAPIYYVGYILYCIAYPFIVVIQWLAHLAGWLAWLLSLPFVLLAKLVGLVLYALWWLITLIPWIFFKIFMFFAGLLGQTIAAIVLVCVILALLAFVVNVAGAGPGAVLALICLAPAGVVALYGLNAFLAIIMCPAQFLYGTGVGVADNLVYFRAVATMNYAAV